MRTWGPEKFKDSPKAIELGEYLSKFYFPGSLTIKPYQVFKARLYKVNEGKVNCSHNFVFLFASFLPDSM